ncbi:MAG: phospholipase [Alphaproteobacteria bacterium]|nr:phospholipase [Alphaproteobacteria bacterium]
MFQLDGPSHGPEGGGAPKRLVVLLHGYGADGDDLIGLAPVLAPILPDAVFHAPNAPFPCAGNPFGRQWFGISGLDPHLMLAGVRAAAPFVDTFLDDTMARYGLDEARTALVGFSQGTMMSLHVGPRRKRPLAGIVGFSGLLAGAEVLKDEIASRPPVLLVHGDSDEMVPSRLSEIAARVLKDTNVETGLHVAKGVGHSIDQSGLTAAARFLKNVLETDA